MTRLAPYVFAGGTAVVTGAAGGMGEQLARLLADRGSALVLVDRDADRLAAVVAAIRAAHPALDVSSRVVDLAEPEQVTALADWILAEHPRPTLLVNNAGVALAGRFDQLTMTEFDWVLQVNFAAPVALTHALLPALLASPGSHIVNLSSLYGLVAPAGQTAYAASKFALRGFSQALGGELERCGVGVTTVHPGGIRTRIAETARIAAAASPAQAEAGKARMAKLLTYPADRAAAEILDGVQHRRPRVLITRTATALDLLSRLLPVGHQRLLTRLSLGARRR
ncbi:SDR family NAD(P)-dependent oxidoreductase [uncultured Friedmanniella sp.]|uniref:SDR family NAD(P)-dependent oxidoreductase n=1 Tax=uncultured Friedmanniella sp. TaxID=335381 RepID=UPI0035CC01B3